MPRIDSEKFYESAINMHGVTAQGLNWSSKLKQELRFEVILELLPSHLKTLNIGDAGCGFGDFYLFMQKLQNEPLYYLGIDSLVDMYSIASDRTAQEILIADITKEPLPSMDWYICSGALNVLTKFESYQFISNCFKSSKKGFIFNTLYGDKKSETYNYLTMQDIETLAKELNVRDITFKEGYIENDITLRFLK